MTAKNCSLTGSITDTRSSHLAATASQASTAAVGPGSTDSASSSHAEDVSHLQLLVISFITPECEERSILRERSLLFTSFLGERLCNTYIYITRLLTPLSTRTREGSQGYIWVILNQQLERLRRPSGPRCQEKETDTFEFSVERERPFGRAVRVLVSPILQPSEPVPFGRPATGSNAHLNY